MISWTTKEIEQIKFLSKISGIDPTCFAAMERIEIEQLTRMEPSLFIKWSNIQKQIYPWIMTQYDGEGNKWKDYQPPLFEIDFDDEKLEVPETPLPEFKLNDTDRTLLHSWGMCE